MSDALRSPTVRHTNMVAALAALVWLAGCASSFDHAGADADAGGSADVATTMFAGAGVAAKCQHTEDCRKGLSCVSLTCKPTGTTAENGACLLTAECAAGLQCGWAGFCKPAGGAALGAECSSSSGCNAGLYCNLIGLSGTCQAYSATAADIGAACKAQADCMGGLTCSAVSHTCVPGSLTLNPDLYPGVECYDDDEAKLPFQAQVVIPRKGVAADFYSLPFPNDIRRHGTTLDVADHPFPGPGLIGLDTVARVVAAMKDGMGGWGLTTAFYVRFTRAIDAATLTTTGNDPTVRLINLSTGAAVPIDKDDIHFEPSRNKYICANWLYVHARWSYVLEPNTTYALLLTDGIGLGKDQKGSNVATQAADFAALLAATAPADVAVKSAWDAYAPLRTWLKTAPFSSSKLIAGAVMTTGNARAHTQELAELATTQTLAPFFALSGQPVLCTSPATVSPCATPDWAKTDKAMLGMADPRACVGDPNAAYYEIHAKIHLPIFQQGFGEGLRPYTDKGGGGLALDPDGKATLVDYEDVCMALTVPKAAAPAAGWPLLVFGHGTGGSFRSAADSIAREVSRILPTGCAKDACAVRYATLAIDQPMHGPRQGGKGDADPGPLFYNFGNPQASRGNFYQGAADNYSLLRWAKDWKAALPGSASTVGVVDFDDKHFVYMGHSQGGTSGPMFLPYATPLSGAVLSGAGGSLVYGLLGKKLPYDASVGLRLGLQEMAINAYHPVLNLFQTYFESSDPLIYAPLFYMNAPIAPLHILHTYGQNDSFCPPATSRILAAATGGTLGLPDAAANLPAWFDVMADLLMDTKQLPLSGNVTVGAKTVTGVTVQATNDPKQSLTAAPYDGHFVAFNDQTVHRQLLEFLAGLASGTPTVVK